MKKCNKCNIEKNFSQFHKKKSAEDGYVGICKSCKKIYDQEYRRLNMERIKLNKREKYQENKADILSKQKKYKEINSNRIKEYQKRYRDTNKEKKKEYQIAYRIKNRNRRNEYLSKRKKEDVLFNITCNIRISINNSFRRLGFSKNSKTEKILGCSFENLKEYLESKFEPWMTWENKGLYNGELNYGWDIDHIIPLSSANTEEDIIKLNHYTNLQPLCSKINRDIKSDSLIY